MTPAETGWETSNKNAKEFGRRFAQGIRKIVPGSRVRVERAEATLPRGWDGGFYAVLRVMPKDAEPFRVAITFYAAEDGEMSGNAAFDGGPVISGRVRGDLDVTKWIRHLLGEMEGVLRARA